MPKATFSAANAAKESLLYPVHLPNDFSSNFNV
jgi:hypothetical protein